ncbi:GNAT family N-acyltransferase [Cereibacter sp. SYSU M97828]|nr:GNAT family N-acyltransferase [Cereibacter flavus]
MIPTEPYFSLRLARDERDLMAAQRLRYHVFVEELGGDGEMVDHDRRLERDAFDPHFDHLLLIDRRRDAEALEDVVGVYRLLPGDRAEAAGGFYSEGEYDVSALKSSGRKLLELGRSCVLPEFRGGTAMLHLWNGLADYVAERGIEVLFGTASFHGTDAEALAQPLSYLHQNHLAPPSLRVKARPEQYQKMDLVPTDRIDRKAAMLATPALIKAYLRVGGFVGDGAWIDHAFNTIDVCLVMDTAQMSSKHRDFYARKQGQ